MNISNVSDAQFSTEGMTLALVAEGEVRPRPVTVVHVQIVVVSSTRVRVLIGVVSHSVWAAH
jgi:hypothetical protein